MKRLVVAAAVMLVLAGCGDDEPQVASDPTAESSPTKTPTETPTETPTDGPYPDFAPTDYTFVLAVTCFCPDAGTPIAVTVKSDEVVDAVLAADGTGRGGGTKGDPAPDYLRRTIDDIIREADDAATSGAADVTVDWPAGQDYPSTVRIDGSTMIADDEVGYTISDVVVG